MQGFLSMTIEEHMQQYLDQGIDKKEAMKKVAKDRGVSKRDIYQALLQSSTNQCKSNRKNGERQVGFYREQMFMYVKGFCEDFLKSP